jgi:hypothetical protein
MINTDRLLKLTPVNAQNEENVLELDPEIVFGFLGFPSATNVYIHGTPNHSVFTVKETPEQIKTQMRELADAQK